MTERSVYVNKSAFIPILARSRHHRLTRMKSISLGEVVVVDHNFESDQSAKSDML
ncbi:MAG: hypothetical protein HIU93_07700 [Acidobacteria bacterium]|nr:hypothetical protein [Acidobacteriota bacterium]